MKSTQLRRKANTASSRSRPPTRKLAAGKGKTSSQPAASSKPPKGATSHKFFNGFYAFLVIMGMVVSALGLRTRVRQTNAAPAGQVQTAGAAIDWTRDGGSAGGCQEVQVWPDGKAYSGRCTTAGPSQAVQISLKEEQVSQLRTWVGQFQSFSFDLNPSGSSTNDRIHLAFRGSGTRSATLIDEQAIESYVENLIQTGG